MFLALCGVENQAIFMKLSYSNSNCLRKEDDAMTDEKPTISIILPIYKVEPYLLRCLESIQNQSFSNFEAILVADGSPDNCGKICDEFAAIDTRFRVIHQKTAGLSNARNSALAIAQGQ